MAESQNHLPKIVVQQVYAHGLGFFTESKNTLHDFLHAEDCLCAPLVPDVTFQRGLLVFQNPKTCKRIREVNLIILNYRVSRKNYAPFLWLLWRSCGGVVDSIISVSTQLHRSDLSLEFETSFESI